MQEDPAETIRRLPESTSPCGNPPRLTIQKKISYVLPFISFSILSSFKIFWTIGCTLSICNDTAPATATHQSHCSNNNPIRSVSSRISCKPRTDSKTKYSTASFLLDDYQTDLLENTKAKRQTPLFAKKKEGGENEETQETLKNPQKQDRENICGLASILQLQQIYIMTYSGSFRGAIVYAHCNILSGVLARRWK